MIMASLQAWGSTPSFMDMLKMSRRASLALGPRFLRKAGGMSSGPGAHFVFIRLMASVSSSIVIGQQPSSGVVLF